MCAEQFMYGLIYYWTFAGSRCERKIC